MPARGWPYLRRADKHHGWALEQFSAREQFVSCDAVLAEVCARLQFYGNDPLVALEFVKAGVVTLEFDLQSNIVFVENLMRKYSDHADGFGRRLSRAHDGN